MADKTSMHDLTAAGAQLSRINKIEDRFEIIKILGQGTAGTVYHAIDRARDRKEVALKVLSDIFAFDESTLERFNEEIQICSRINHKNIVQAYDHLEFKECVGYTMELVRGCDLGQLLHNEKFSYSEVESIMYQLMDAISELHSMKIMHRDIKLENIILREDGVVKLSDLGLMKKLESKGMTKPGILLGTPQYMPPEYIKAAKFDERSDIYACGVVFYELLSGQRRLSSKQGVEAIQHLLATKFEVPKLKISKEYSRYNDILEIALDPNPDHRFQSAKEMQSAFGPGQSHSQKGRVIKKRKRSILARLLSLFRKDV